MLTELRELQDQKNQNTDQELKSSDDGITHLKLLTGSFKTFLDNYDVYSNDNDKFQIQNNWLTKNSCVLPGNKIFELMFKGTKFSDCDVKTQQEKLWTLKEDFDSSLEEDFKNVLSDIATLKNDQGQKTHIEGWFDTLKKVMALYKNEDF